MYKKEKNNLEDSDKIVSFSQSYTLLWNLVKCPHILSMTLALVTIRVNIIYSYLLNNIEVSYFSNSHMIC